MNITIETGWEGDDFVMDKRTVKLSFENYVLFVKADKHKANINDDLNARLIIYKATKLFKNLYTQNKDMYLPLGNGKIPMGTIHLF